MIDTMLTFFRPALQLAGALLGACLLLGACALHPRSDGRYRLGRPFVDLYDSAFVLTEGSGGTPRVVTAAQLAAALARYDVVVYGESHGHPGVHLQQMQLLRLLYAHDARWVVSFEQFERDVQGVVDDYLAGRLGEATLMDRGRAWNNYAASYRPLLLFARAHALPVIAAEAPGWAISCVGQWGLGILDRFPPAERATVARQVHVGPGPYRDKYLQFFSGSPSHGGDSVATEAATAAAAAASKADRSFAAQAARDDTMAESIIEALRAHPGYKLLHLTGSFHAEGFLGTVERLRLRDPGLRIAVIDPVEVENPDEPAFTADELHGGTALQLIYPNPPVLVDGEDTGPMMARMTHDRDASRCRYTLP